MTLTVKVTAYTKLGYSYQVGFYDTINSQAISFNETQYNCHESYKTCLTNHMGFKSHHIMLLVINSVIEAYTNTHTHTQTRTYIYTNTHTQHTHTNKHTHSHSWTEAIIKTRHSPGLKTVLVCYYH